MRDACEVAVHSLRVNHVRGALTTAGVLVGVAAIIVVAGLGKGAQAKVSRDFGQLTTQVQITPAVTSQPGVNASPRRLTDTDVAALGNTALVPGVTTVVPVVTGVDVIRSGTGYSSCSIEGTTSDYLTVANRQLVAGTGFSAGQARDNARVVLLGPGPAQRLFGADPGAAVGQRVQIARTSFRVIGVLRANDANDAIAVMPLGAARTYVVGGADSVGKIIVDTDSNAAVAPAVTDIITTLSARHHINNPAKRDFTVTAQNTIITTIDRFFVYLGVFIIGAASISLIVGGVGIANVMLVSVAERTKEIGIRRAVGARRREITTQFLLESVVLSGMGGVCGVVVGVVLTVAMAAVSTLFTSSYGTPEISLTAVVLGFGVSVGIGIIAGVYPARRAARITPIDALRYE